jgi:hypothetical protein
VERIVRNGAPRHLVRRRGLSALLLVGALPWAAAGWLSAQPAFYAGAGLFLVAALFAYLPALELAVESDTLRVLRRSPLGRVERSTTPLSDLKALRVLEKEGRAELWLDVGGRSLRICRAFDVPELRRQAERLAQDLHVPVS